MGMCVPQECVCERMYVHVSVTPGSSNIHLSENFIYPTLFCDPPSLSCGQCTLIYPTPGLPNTWFIQHLVYPTPGSPNTWFIQHLVYPTPGLSHTWFTQHLVYPTPGVSNTWFIQHQVYPTPGLSNTRCIQHLVHPTPGLSNTWFKGRTCLGSNIWSILPMYVPMPCLCRFEPCSGNIRCQVVLCATFRALEDHQHCGSCPSSTRVGSRVLQCEWLPSQCAPWVIMFHLICSRCRCPPVTKCCSSPCSGIPLSRLITIRY